MLPKFGSDGGFMTGGDFSCNIQGFEKDWWVRCSFSKRIAQLRMQWKPTPALGLKPTCTWSNQMALRFGREFTPCILSPTLGFCHATGQVLSVLIK
jgi:hypothetical protein